MSDNKLKIRIQLQQPKAAKIDSETDITEASVPELDAQAAMEKPPFDRRKIAVALFLLLAIVGLIGALFFGRGDNETPAVTEEVYSGTEESAVEITEKFDDSDNDDAGPVPDRQPEQAENDLSAKGDEAVTVENAEKEALSDVFADTPDSKPPLSQEPNLPLPELKPDVEVAAQQVELHEPQSGDDEIAALPEIPDTLETLDASDTPDMLGNLNEEVSDDHVHVTRAQLTHAVKQREPVDEVSRLQLEPEGHTNIYFYVELNGLAGQYVSVNWYFKDELVTATRLRVGGKNWRTYASKLFNQKNAGQWRVSLTDKAGNQLAERHFVVSSQM